MKKSSIERRLIGSTLLIFLVAWLGVLLLAVIASGDRFYERVDRQVENEARHLNASLRALARTAAGCSQAHCPDAGIEQLDASFLTPLIERGEDYAVRIWAGPRLMARTDDALPLDIAIVDPSPRGFSTLGETLDGVKRVWRIYRVEDEVLGVTLVVAYDLQDLAVFVDGLLLYFFWPLFASLPIAFLALAIGIRYSLRPLSKASSQIRDRDVEDLRPLDLLDRPREIAPLIDAIEGLFQRLQRAFEAERRFTADASHELRTPLAALRINTQLLERDHPELANHPALIGLLECTDRANRLVGQLLMLARLEPESARPASSPILLRPLLESCAEQVSLEIVARDLDFDLRCDPDLQVHAVAAALELMVGNLLANAVRYGSAGGRIRVSAHDHDGALVLCFDNEGELIPAELRSRLFDRFYRPAGSPGLGAGLGLAIVRRAVQLHRGRVEILESDDFHGVRVRAELPAVISRRIVRG